MSKKRLELFRFSVHNDRENLISFNRETILTAITFIGSGSKGNAALLELGSSFYLLDAGLSCKKITDFLATRNLNLYDLAGVFVTHEHDDHVKGLRVILNKNPELPVLCTKGTASALRHKGIASNNFINLSYNQEIECARVRCVPFKVPHDATEPVGLRFEYSGKVMSIATDLGHITRDVLHHMEDADLMCIESNYDESMLRTSIYPGWLKQRIKSPLGHLPNEGFRGVLSRMKKDPQIMVLMHISQESNTYRNVKDGVQSFLDLNPEKFGGTKVSIALQNEPGERLALSSGLSETLKKKFLVQKTFADIWSPAQSGTGR